MHMGLHYKEIKTHASNAVNNSANIMHLKYVHAINIKPGLQSFYTDYQN